jgi:hypothetical protein
MAIFGACDGEVFKAETQCPTIAAIKVDGFITTVPVTGYTLELNTNHQFLHSLDEFIYVFAFGDRIGELTLSGISFTGTVCGTSGPITDAAADSIYKYYADNRLAAKTIPAQITIGGNQSSAQLLGFLTGMRLELPNPANPIAQWTLRFAVILNPAAGGAVSAPRPIAPLPQGAFN